MGYWHNAEIISSESNNQLITVSNALPTDHPAVVYGGGRSDGEEGGLVDEEVGVPSTEEGHNGLGGGGRGEEEMDDLVAERDNARGLGGKIEKL